MDGWKEVLGAVSVVIGMVMYVPYLRGMWSGQVKPHAMTWLVWGALTGTAFAIQVSEDGGPGTWMMAMSAATCLYTGAWALWHGDRQFPLVDWACMAGVVGAGVVWLGADDALLAVVAITTIDCLATTPTLRKSWSAPYEEQAAVFFWAAVNTVLGIAALTTYNVTVLLYPVALVALNAVVAVVVLGRRRVVGRPGVEVDEPVAPLS